MSHQINSTTNRVMTKTVNASLQNFQLMNGLTTIVNTSAKISDLLEIDSVSDTQTLLTSTKTIMDYAIARGLANMVVVEEVTDQDGTITTPGSVKFNYNQQYSNSPSSTTSLTLYQIDLSYFYVYDNAATNDYTPKSNSVLYDSGSVTNAAYISQVNNVISSMGQCLSLITDIMSTLN